VHRTLTSKIRIETVLGHLIREDPGFQIRYFPETYRIYLQALDLYRILALAKFAFGKFREFVMSSKTRVATRRRVRDASQGTAECSCGA